MYESDGEIEKWLKVCRLLLNGIYRSVEWHTDPQTDIQILGGVYTDPQTDIQILGVVYTDPQTDIQILAVVSCYYATVIPQTCGGIAA